MDVFSIKNKIALVTGSNQGLGLVLARGLARAGARVIINGRKENKLKNTYSELKNEDLDVYYNAFDVIRSDQVEESIIEIENEIGEVDILVNNAGIQIRHPLEEFPEEDWDNIIDINLKGAYVVAKQVVPGMIERQQGKIINICSLQSELGRETISPYAASKGGLKMLTKGMATEWGQYNIQVNAIGPGYFKSEMTKELWKDEEFDNWLKGRTPANRWGDPEELVGPAIFLASAASDYLNGHILYVDGGMLSCV